LWEYHPCGKRAGNWDNVEEDTMKRAGYVGKAGHLAVMGEIAFRGYNVAMPEVDYGDDIFVAKDATGKLWRVQVKTATPVKSNAKRIRAERFEFGIRQNYLLGRDNSAPAFIVFAMRSRYDPRGWRFLVLRRERLKKYHKDNKIGWKRGKMVNFKLSIHHDGKQKGKVFSQGQELTRWMEKWDPWPVLEHA
jgi:hypothetical protein